MPRVNLYLDHVRSSIYSGRSPDSWTHLISQLHSPGAKTQEFAEPRRLLESLLCAKIESWRISGRETLNQSFKISSLKGGRGSQLCLGAFYPFPQPSTGVTLVTDALLFGLGRGDLCE